MRLFSCLMLVAAAVLAVAQTLSFAKVGNLRHKFITPKSPVWKPKHVPAIALKDLGKRFNFAKAGQIIFVPRGTFRYTLLPNGLATRVDPIQFKKKEEMAKLVESRMAADLERATEMKKVVDALPRLEFSRKVREGTTGQIYGSLSAANVADEISTRTGFKIEPDMIELPQITETGQYSGMVNLAPGVATYVKVEVTADGAAGDGE